MDELGFPDFYGRNMDAWIDCMTSLDYPEHGLSRVTVEKGDVLVLNLADVRDFKQRCPELYTDLVECAAFVNWRRIAKGGTAILALSYRASQ
jgi:hypothetical protein